MVEKVLGFKVKDAVPYTALINTKTLEGKQLICFPEDKFVPVVSLEEHRRLLTKEVIRVNNAIKASDKLFLKRLHNVVSLEWLEKTALELKNKESALPKNSDYEKAWINGFGTAMRRIVLAAKKEAGKNVKK